MKKKYLKNCHTIWPVTCNSHRSRYCQIVNIRTGYPFTTNPLKFYTRIYYAELAHTNTSESPVPHFPFTECGKCTHAVTISRTELSPTHRTLYINMIMSHFFRKLKRTRKPVNCISILIQWIVISKAKRQEMCVATISLVFRREDVNLHTREIEGNDPH